MLRYYLREKEFVAQESVARVLLHDGREIVFADEPDIAVYRDRVIQVAIEVKGGIDTAAILERVGAAIKSLRRAKDYNPASITILLIQEVSLTQQAIADLEINQTAVNYWFTIEEFLHDEAKQADVLQLLGV